MKPRLLIIGFLACIIVTGLLFLTWWSLWKWNDTISGMMIMGNVQVFRQILEVMAKELSEDNGSPTPGAGGDSPIPSPTPPGTGVKP